VNPRARIPSPLNIEIARSKFDRSVPGQSINRVWTVGVNAMQLFVLKKKPVGPVHASPLALPVDFQPFFLCLGNKTIFCFHIKKHSANRFP
jgi:hypothetical protein